MRKLSGKAGFTLVELMVGLGIVILLATISIPAVMNSTPKFRFRSDCRELAGMFNRARFEAVNRKIDIGIAFNLPNQYTLFVDDGAGIGTAGNATQDGTEQTITTVTTASNVILVQSGATAWTQTGYNSQGLPLGNRIGSIIVRGTMRDGTFKNVTLTISNSGHVRLLDTTDSGNQFNF